jgi:hypothetical protein
LIDRQYDDYCLVPIIY